MVHSHTFLFDIDGTLLFSGGAGQVAMQRTMVEWQGEFRPVDIPVHGRTDRAIIEDLLSAHELPVSDGTVEQFYDRYVEHLRDAMAVCAGRVLRGVRPLLEYLEQRGDVAIGLLTGNGTAAAEIKLTHYELWPYFRFGGFGERVHDRNQIARQAVQSAERHLGYRPDAKDTWVIGDTIHDVRCARAVGANVLAVGTGKVDHDELRASRPDRFLNDLGDLQEFVVQVGLD